MVPQSEQTHKDKQRFENRMTTIYVLHAFALAFAWDFDSMHPDRSAGWAIPAIVLTAVFGFIIPEGIKSRYSARPFNESSARIVAGFLAALVSITIAILARY